MSHRTNIPVSVVIPAYNEAQTISAVLAALLPVGQVAQIIVVDDGSTDDTGHLARQTCACDSRFRLVRQARNAGKARAMLAGAHLAEHEVVLFLDADLIGVKPDHIRSLAAPVAQGKVEMAIARFSGGRRQTDWSHRLTPFLSGQRCLRWSRFAGMPGFAEAGWSIEVGLTLHARRQGYAVAWVAWPGVTHRMRPEKRPGLAGYWSHLRMWADIARYLLHQTRHGPSPVSGRTSCHAGRPQLGGLCPAQPYHLHLPHLHKSTQDR
ncbi:MAG TPA: glycosyltransferase family 2 protein [Caldilineaceae bacterium]|nr:glycosyltransferase family 2 protein [Caldilineaceae bacterium]